MESKEKKISTTTEKNMEFLQIVNDRLRCAKNALHRILIKTTHQDFLKLDIATRIVQTQQIVEMLRQRIFIDKEK